VFARVARYEVPEDRLEEAGAAFGQAGEEIKHLDGFAGGYVLVDSEDGRMLTLTLWENSATLESSEHAAGAARRHAAEAAGGNVLSVEKFEVAHSLAAQPSSV
jgi:heme-degrading monooxygenase HmoA